MSAALADAAPAILALGRAQARALSSGGRVIALGAGTSGRLAILDAAEWRPTFGVAPDRVVGRIAGGADALVGAVEGAEDDADAGAAEIESLAVGPQDLVVGISASGGAPYVRAALDAAARRGAARALITASSGTASSGMGDDDGLLLVALDLGPELLSGSTRLKAATATHRVLLRASCLAALELGWIHRGRMVEMRPTNRKLRARAARIVGELAPCTPEEAARALEASGDDLKVAIVSAGLGVGVEEARARLASVGRRLDAIEGLG